MKDEELKLEEIEASHTIGGAVEVGRGEGRGEGVDDTLLLNTLDTSISGSVAITNKPVCHA